MNDQTEFQDISLTLFAVERFVMIQHTTSSLLSEEMQHKDIKSLIKILYFKNVKCKFFLAVKIAHLTWVPWLLTGSSAHWQWDAQQVQNANLVVGKEVDSFGFAKQLTAKHFFPCWINSSTKS